MKRIATLGLHHDHAWSNLEELQATGKAELVAAADHLPQLLEKYSEKFPGNTYADYDELLANEDLDAVYIFGSNRLNEDLAVKACERGLHCLVEKPMASTFGGAERMLAAAEANHVRLMINWPFAWLPELRHGIAMAQAGELGQLSQVKYRASHEGPRELGCSAEFCDWLYDEKLNGAGALMDYCCYGSVLANVLLGRPEKVTGTKISTGTKPDFDLEDNAILLLTYPKAIAMAEASWTQVGEVTSYIATIYGSEGTVQIDPAHGGKITHATHENPYGVEIEVPHQPEHLANASKHFLALLDDPDIEIHPLCDPQHGLDAQWTLQRGIEAASTD